LFVISTANLRVLTVIHGLGNPQGVVVAPDGKTVYVTNTVQGRVEVISAARNKVTRTIRVGELPWQLVISADGSKIYVADGDSNAISVISTASDKVTNTIPDPGDPVSVALTPDGSAVGRRAHLGHRDGIRYSDWQLGRQLQRRLWRRAERGRW
jgi:YVTN family beta-propeller protein